MVSAPATAAALVRVGNALVRVGNAVLCDRCGTGVGDEVFDELLHATVRWMPSRIGLPQLV